MSEHILETFKKAKAEKRPLLIAYTMAGYRTREDTVKTILALEKGGADIIELGIPFTDPIADGPTIQKANTEALKHRVTFRDTLQFVRDARKEGLKAPLILMGYYNPLLIYGERKSVIDAKEAGANGFIVVDLPPEEAVVLCSHLKEFGLSFIPLICPTTSPARIEKLASLANSFIYCVSINGITGVREGLPPHLSTFISKVRAHASNPLAVGFGISSHDQFVTVGKISEGVVIGSAFIKAIENAPPGSQAEVVKNLAKQVITGKNEQSDILPLSPTKRAEPGAAIEGGV
eukprot:TRINITY_DN5364_c0_g1_i3.p1 TRINITY_DN5364_c0_g1~~TRINITY_DN5364_c0_g1_i3.p1  ORF type:complete len:290 (-),score=68.98 TRINITY_DN5364_c0_g1_i3:105-974(-)